MDESLAPWEGEPTTEWSTPASTTIDAGDAVRELDELARRRLGPGLIVEPPYRPVIVGKIPTRKRDKPKNRGARHRAGDHVLTFGRYKGKTLHRVRVENKGYLDWIADNEGFSMPSVRKIVRTYLGRRD